MGCCNSPKSIRPIIERKQEPDKKNIGSENQLIDTQLSVKDNGKEKTPIDKISRNMLEPIVMKAPERTKSSLNDLCEYLRKNSSTLCNEERAWLVYRWLGLNIDYDVEGLASGEPVDVTPEGAYKNGKTVCSGYSRLYKTIADTLELETICVNGYAKGVGYDPEVSFNKTNHEWNFVKVDGKWFPLDSTWGGGAQINGKHVKRYTPYYFGPDPKNFIRSHLPVDPQWQLLEDPVSKESFERSLKYSHVFYDYGLISTEPDIGVIERNDTAICTIKYNQKINTYMKIELCYQINGKYEEVKNGWFMEKLNEHFLGSVALNKKGKYNATFYVKYPEEELYHGAFDLIINCDRDSNTHKEFPEIYGMFHQTGAILYEPKYAPLKKGSTVFFKIEVKNAIKVMVDTKTQILLTKEGDLFSGNVEINSDKIVIYYMYAGMTSYSGLLNYSVN